MVEGELGMAEQVLVLAKEEELLAGKMIEWKA